jgi:2-ketoarginine methyltransferase
MVDENFEARLIDALQPIRGFALAQGIYHFFVTGLFDRMSLGPRRVEDLADGLEMDRQRLFGFLVFLANEELVVLHDDVACLTDRSRDLGEFRPWYELLVGGYAETFQQITKTLRGNGYGTRDGVLVGIGSCGISRYDALPLVRSLLADMPSQPSTIVDLGCGDGRFLTELVRDYPGISAVGVDPFAPADRDDGSLAFRQALAIDYVRDAARPVAGPDGHPLFIAAFLLQELLEQDGRSAVVELVNRIVRDRAYLVVVEVDHRPTDHTVMRHGLGLAYYNPYYLLHVLTEQKLEGTEFWLDLFDDAGAVVVSRRSVDPRVDSTGLEFGCLLATK